MAIFSDIAGYILTVLQNLATIFHVCAILNVTIGKNLVRDL